MRNPISVVLAGFLLSFAGGATYSWGVFTVPLMELFGWTKYEANLSFTVFMTVFAFCMLPAGMLADRFGYRRIARFGALLFVPAYLLAALVELTGHTLWLPATHGLLGGMGCAAVYAVIAPAVRSQGFRRPAFAVSVAVMGFGLAAVAIAPLKARLLIPGMGIGGTLAIIGLVAAGISFGAASLLPATAPVSGIRSETGGVVSGTLRSGVFFPLWLLFAASVAGGFLALGIFPSYAINELGWKSASASLLVMLFAAVNGLGRPFAGLLAERFGYRGVLLITGSLQVLLLGALGFVQNSGAVLVAATAVCGWMFATVLGLFPSITASVLGEGNLGTRYGMVFTGFAFGAISLSAGGMLYDASGSFTPVFLRAAGVSAVGVLLGIVLFRKRKEA